MTTVHYYQNETAPVITLSTVAPSTPSSSTISRKSPTNYQFDQISCNSSNLTVPIHDDNMSQATSCLTINEDDDNNNATIKPQIPDGGWGWMVVFSSLIMSMIMDGISFSFGLLYIEFLYEFKASKSVTSWIGSLFVAVPLLTGPVMSALVDKYGCRSMTIAGGLVATIGFVLSSYARSVIVMYVTFGVIAGLGLGLTYVTAVVSIAFWFDKNRNLAVGLGACGTGIGTFVYAPFTTYLLGEFGWRGTVLLLSGTLLNMCVCGALMRDPQWIIQQNKMNAKLSKSSRSKSKSSTLSQHSSCNNVHEKHELNEIRRLLKDGKDAEYVLQTLAFSVPSENGETAINSNKEHHQSVLNLPTFIRKNEKVPLEVLEHLSENKNLYKIILENYPSLLLCRSTSEKGLNKLAEDTITRVPVTFSMKLKKNSITKSSPPTKNNLMHQYSLPDNPAMRVNEPLLTTPMNENKKPPRVVKRNLTRTNSAPRLVKPLVSPHQNYFRNMRFPRQSMTQHGAVLNMHKYRLRASSCPNIYRVSMTTLAQEEDEQWYSPFVDIFKGIFDFSLFLEFHFFLMSLSTIILFAWFMTPYFYLADHMKLADYTTTEASFVLSTIGVTNTIGMVLLGWAGDQAWTNVSKTYAVCLVLCGTFCSFIMYFTTNYVMLTISAAFYGIFLASSFSFTPIILVELVPLERFTTAYGLILMCQGIGHLGGPPVAGLLYDITLQWNFSFYLSGFWIIIAGILIGIIPLTANRKMIGIGPVEKELSNDV